jgi:hypothetical protein
MFQNYCFERNTSHLFFKLNKKTLFFHDFLRLSINSDISENHIGNNINSNGSEKSNGNVISFVINTLFYI